MILIIDNYDSFTYNLYQCVAQIADEVTVIRNDKISIDEIIALQPSHIILSPGPGRPENSGICVEIIQSLGKSIPILGVCLGHQAIVLAFGGVIDIANKIVHGKKALIFHDRKNIFRDLPLPFFAGRYHSLIAERNSLPESLTITAETSDGTVMGVKHREHQIYGVQFHPESILTPEGHRVLQEFLRC